LLAKKHRFHGHNSLNFTYRKGETIRSPYCAMRFVPGKHEDFRVAVVVSKKVAKSAPDRNRIRRRVYETIRELAPKLITNEDIVVTIFDERFIDMPHTELVATLKRQLEQIAKYNKENTHSS
jgi:ribonuclease P protein component